MIANGDYDVVILDEFTYPMHYGWIPGLNGRGIGGAPEPSRNAPRHHHHQGRNAPDALVEFADLVTEMNVVKHPYQQGIKAQPGIEF